MIFIFMNLDPRQILQHPLIYTTYQKIVGGYRARKLFVDNDVKPQKGQQILDIGCGPGDILDFLNDVNYVGIDIDSDYISKAKQKYGHKGKFLKGTVDQINLNGQKFDTVFSAGVLHHLTDKEVLDLLNFAKKHLKREGIFVSFDGVFIDNQNKISRYFLKKDRGQYIRTTKQYLSLAEQVFPNVTYSIDETYFRIPYTSIIIKCDLSEK